MSLCRSIAQAYVIVTPNFNIFAKIPRLTAAPPVQKIIIIYIVFQKAAFMRKRIGGRHRNPV